MGWSVGAFFFESLSVRASGSVRDHEVPMSASIDSRENLKDGRFRSLRDSSRRLLCSHLTGALVRPRRCALHLWGFWGSLPCALVAALPSFASIHSWSSGLSTRLTQPQGTGGTDSWGHKTETRRFGYRAANASALLESAGHFVLRPGWTRGLTARVADKSSHSVQRAITMGTLWKPRSHNWAAIRRPCSAQQ